MYNNLGSEKHLKILCFGRNGEWEEKTGDWRGKERGNR